MKHVNTIPHLKVYLQQTYLPITEDPLRGAVVFLNTPNQDASIKAMKNPFIRSNNKYKFYYMDDRYYGKLFTKEYRINRRRKRLEEYQQIEEAVGNITALKDLSFLKGRNLYYDLCLWNEIFFKYTNGRNFKQVIQSYVPYIRKLVADDPIRLPDLHSRTMLIGIEDWIHEKRIESTNKAMAATNPILIFLYLMKYHMDQFVELGQIDILFHTPKGVLRIVPADCDKDTYVLFKREFGKLLRTINITEEIDEDALVEMEERKAQLVSKVGEEVRYLTGKPVSIPAEEKEVSKRVGPIEQEEIQTPDEEFVENKTQEIVDRLMEEDRTEDLSLHYASDLKGSSTKQFIGQIHEYNKETDKRTGEKARTRDQKLREEVKNIKLQEKTINQLATEARHVSERNIQKRSIQRKIHSPNKNIKEVGYPEFDKQYVEHVMTNDYINCFRALEDRSIGMSIVSIKQVDTSDELNYKDTLYVVMEDKNRVRHHVTVDIPKIIDNRYMLIGGNKKILYKQKFPYPIMKLGPDKVQICTNYNKMFVHRYGLRITENVERLNGLLSGTPLAILERGNNIGFNKKYITTFEYDEVASRIIRLKTKEYLFLFNLEEFQREYPEVKSILEKQEKIPVGIHLKDKSILYLGVDSQRMENTEEGLIEFMVSKLDVKDQELYESAKTGTKFIHSRVAIMNRKIPLVLLLAYCESFTGLLRIAGIPYRFSDKRVSNLSRTERVIRFNDGYFIYTANTFATELLMNGMTTVPTRAYDFEAFDEKETYVDLFESLYGSRILGNALENFYENLIDPKTLEILEYLNYPTTFTKLILFANELLSDNNSIPEDSMEQFRIRSFEMLPGMLYKGVADAYGAYRLTASNTNPVKVSLPKDYLLKKVSELQVVEDYSEINPLTELEKSRTITPKGHSGLNLDRAYTLDKRTYSPSMKGIYAISTSPDSNVGVSRALTLEPKIKNIYGMVELEDDTKLKDVNLFSPAEITSPLGVTSDDATRTSMAVKQTKHMIPVDKSSPVLISNGVEETVPYYLSKDFVIVAEEDGEIVEITDKVAIAKYKGGKIQSIDLRPRVVKNSGGGFYLSNKYKLNFKKGQKFKKDEIIAQDNRFFTHNKYYGTRLNIGSLQKVALGATNMTMEDSSEITMKMAKDLKSEIVTRVAVAIDKSSNIDYICRVNETFQTGDELIRFDTSTGEEAISKFLASVREDLHEDILSLSKNRITTKVTGVIEDIKIYSTVEEEELSPSLRKVVRDYYKERKEFQQTVDKHLSSSDRQSIYRGGVYMNDTVSHITPTKQGKLKGKTVGEGVLIEFYIKFDNYLGIGDKITFFTALKSEPGDIVPEGYEAFSLLRPHEEVSSFIGTSADIARKTPSIEKTLAGNKFVVELKRRLWEIYYERDWNSQFEE